MHMSGGGSVPGLCTFREDNVHTNLMNALNTHTYSQMHLANKTIVSIKAKSRNCKMYINICCFNCVFKFPSYKFTVTLF